MIYDFGTLKFNNNEEYYEALGSFCNQKAFSISYEPNKKTGSYADAYRIRKLSAAKNLIKPITDALRSGGRINCNKYVQALLLNHYFIQNNKLIYGILENVIQTVPFDYTSYFIKGYTNSSALNERGLYLYGAELIKLNADNLKKVDIPKAKNVSTRSNDRIEKTKHDYIKKEIKQMQIGERGERLVFEYEKKRLNEAKKNGIIKSVDDKIKWVSLEDDTAGYDILSYDVDKGTPLYIEVKTTVGVKTTPFYMSKGEAAFSKNHSANYRLYRVFNLKNDVAEYYELSGNIFDNNSVTVESDSYKVELKKE